MGLSLYQSPPSEIGAEERLHPAPQLEYWPSMGVVHYPGVATLSIGISTRNYNRSVKFDGHIADVIYGSTEVKGVKQENHWTFDIHNLRFREEATGAVWVLSAELFLDGERVQTIELPGIAVEPKDTRHSTPEIFNLELEEPAAPAYQPRRSPVIFH